MVKQLPIHHRLLNQLAASTIRSWQEALIELITNSDDSYKRLESRGLTPSGIITITINRPKGGKGASIVIEDEAEGMSKETLMKAITFAAETSGFTSGMSVRGYFGRGLKEAIIALGEGEIETVKDGILSRTKIWRDSKHGPVYDEVMLNNSEPFEYPNSTRIKITIKNDKIKIPEANPFIEQLKTNYALRDILQNPNRKVNVEFSTPQRKSTGVETRSATIKFTTPESKLVVDKDIILNSNGIHDKIRFRIYEAYNKLDFTRKSPNNPAGILIKTCGAILDNQLFKFESNEAAYFFFGEAICPGIEDLLKVGDNTVIDTNRQGLEWSHPYCKALMEAIEAELQPLVESKMQDLADEQQKNPKESTRRSLERISKILNKLAAEELEELPAGLIDNEPDIEGLIIKPEIANVPEGHERAISIYAPRKIVELCGRKVFVSSDNKNISIQKTVNLKQHSKYPDIFTNYLKVKGYGIGNIARIKAEINGNVAYSQIKVTEYTNKPKGKLSHKKVGFLNQIRPSEEDNPKQRAAYRDQNIEIFIKFPGISKFIRSGLEGLDNPASKILFAELIAEAFCRELARQGIENGKYHFVPNNEIDGYNTAYWSIQARFLPLIHEAILKEKF